MKGAISFEKKVEIVLENGFTEQEKSVVRAWYAIESADEDISTERLIARTQHATHNSNVVKIMGKFSRQYDKIFGDE